MTRRRLFVIPSAAEESLRGRALYWDVLPERCFDFAQHDKGTAQHDMAPLNMTWWGAPAPLSTTW